MNWFRGFLESLKGGSVARRLTDEENARWESQKRAETRNQRKCRTHRTLAGPARVDLMTDPYYGFRLHVGMRKYGSIDVPIPPRLRGRRWLHSYFMGRAAALLRDAWRA